LIQGLFRNGLAGAASLIGVHGRRLAQERRSPC
jgi:hypothetical protein